MYNSLSRAETTDGSEKIEYWAPDQFSDVLYPSEFGIGENLIWGLKVLFNHPDIKELVPGYAYSYADICTLVDKNNLPGARIVHVGTNELKKFTETACDESQGKSTSNSQHGAVNALSKILEKSNISASYSAGSLVQSDDLLVLTGDEVPDIEPAVAFWWRCDNQKEQNPDTVCHEVFQYSPFSKHKKLVVTD